MRQNGIHQEYIEIRNVIGQNNIWTCGQLGSSDLSCVVKAQNSKGPAPDHKHIKCAFFIAITKEQRVDERKKEDRHDREENANVDFPDQR